MAVNAPVQYAIEGDDLYLLDEDGNEHSARIVKTILKPHPIRPERPAETMQPASNANRSPIQANASTVVIKSTPDGADITVDGKFVGMTPSTLRLPPGDYWLLVQKMGFKDWRRTITLSSGGNVTIDTSLEKTL